MSDDIVAIAKKHLSDGANILEIGGESTGPASKDVSPEEELSRVAPLVSLLRTHIPTCWICIDTWKSSVARECLALGADCMNDVTAGRGDPAMLRTVAEAGASIILMYSKDSSARTTVEPVQYDDVIKSIKEFLIERIVAAESAGIPRDRIIVDPGLGHFVSSDPTYSYEILARLHELSELGPILVSPSRKSFLAGPSKLPPEERLWPTVATSLLGALSGASLIRTHDTKEVRGALDRVGLLPK